MRPPEYHFPIDSRRVRRAILRFGIFILAIIALFQSISFYVDGIWFESLGYGSVFWYRLRAEALVFLGFAIASAVVLWCLFRFLVKEDSGHHRLRIGGEWVIVPSTSSLRGLSLPIAIILGILFGLTYSTNWNTFALFFNRPPAGELSDPVFGRPLSFYFFSLPVLESIAGWFLAISIITVVVSLVVAATHWTGGLKGVSLALSLLLAALALETYVGRYDLILDDHALFSGVRYVDAHFLLPGLLFVVAALILGAVVAAVNVRSGRLSSIGIAIAIPALTYAIAGVAVPLYVTTFIVRPNELVREKPYIQNNIEFTRKAFGLDKVEEIPFEPRLTNAVIDPVKHAASLENIRLWDWRALQATLRQIQEIRTYYDFVDVDIDRYTIDGRAKAMMLAARELSRDKLPSGSQNWINERLIYTHGYGVTMNPVNQFTKEGLPQLVLSNMPVESTVPEVQLTRPEIYFGELTKWPVYVKTKQKEFNFPQGESNNYSTYEGSGGIRMGSLLRRLVLAWTVGDLAKVPFSDDITADSMLLMRRDIKERVLALAPFLTYDDDPYIVVADGRLFWIMDAFTQSDRYPYSRHLMVGPNQINYIRNSVKVVVDAYNGSVDFYIFDSQDPLVEA